MKAVALYGRVSTLDQNCELQFEDLRRYASARFDRTYEYVDQGVSGAQRHRPALDNLMRDARKRRFDVVVVWKFDRFARSLKHLLDALEEFKALGIDFVSLTEGIDTTTPNGQLPFSIVGGGSIRTGNCGTSEGGNCPCKLDIPVSRVRRVLARNLSVDVQSSITAAAPVTDQ